MGEGTYVKPLRAAGGQRSLNLRIDVPLLLIVITLLIFGLLMVYSASWDYSYVVLGKEPWYMFIRQIRSLAVGLVGAVVLMVIPYQRFRRLVVPMMAVVLGSLIAVLVINKGSTTIIRTMLAGSIQPSELAKVATVVYLAFWLYSKREQLNNIWFGLFPMAGIIGITGGLILMQPDISAVITVMALGIIMFFLAGGAWRQIAVVALVGVVVMWIMVQFSDTAAGRLTDFIAGLRDPAASSDQILRSLEAIVKGGWFGVGIGRADTKFTGLPLPPTDSIFAVVAEELGVVGIIGLVALYAGLLWRGMVIARRAPDQLGALLAGGLTLWIVIEAVINMAVIAGLLPVAGNALPFISAGGSSLVCNLAAIGVIMNVARCSVDKQSEEGRTFSAVVDLRGRDRRGRESRTRRPSITR